MSNYASLKSAIQQVIKTNGNNEITGALLQQSLLSMINSLGVGYQFVGIATPSTNPGTPDQNMFYLASTAGTYTNFGGLVLADGEIAILKYNGAWSKDSTGAATQESVNQLGQEIQDISLRDSAFDCGLNLNIFESGFIDCTQNPVTFNRNVSSGWRSAVIAVKSGETYNVKCYSISSAAYGIALFDKNRDILSHQDGNDTTVAVAIEQDGFLVVNHGRTTIPTIIRVKIYSLEEKRNTLKDWILSESFSLRGDATYTDGVISSPISVSYPDESYGEISVTRNSDGDITSLSATNVQLGIRLNMSIVRYADGSVKSQNISFKTL